MEAATATKSVLDLIADLADCETVVDANLQTKEIVEMLGAQSFVYMTLLPPNFNASNECFQFLMGCSPDLCQLYNRRMWMMNDPFLEYARTNTGPIVGSKIKVQTAGQVEIMQMSALHGFQSALVVPTHTSMSASKRMGLLYIGANLPTEEGEAMLLSQRVQFGALGTELLLWWNSRLRHQAMRKYSLLDDEVDLLRLSKKGLVANEIAAQLDVKATVVYRRLNAIKEKFNADKIEQAVVDADAAGLLG